MDILRVGSTYTTDAKFFSDSDEVMKIRWYMCPPDAKIFPGPHSFGSLVWVDRDIPTPAVGEQSRKRTWRKSTNERGYRGQCFTGKAEWFLDGIPRAMATSWPECAECASFALGGGMLVGGSSVQRLENAQLGNGGLLLASSSSQRISAAQLGRAGLLLAGQSVERPTAAQLGRAGLLLAGQSVEVATVYQIGRSGLALGGFSGQQIITSGRAGLVIGGESVQSRYNAQMGRAGLSLGGKLGTAPAGLVRQSTGALAWSTQTGTWTFGEMPLAGNTVVLKLILNGGDEIPVVTDTQGSVWRIDSDSRNPPYAAVIYSAQLTTVSAPYLVTVRANAPWHVAACADEVNGLIALYDFDSSSGTSSTPSTFPLTATGSNQYFGALFVGAPTTFAPEDPSKVPLSNPPSVGEGDYVVTVAGNDYAGSWTIGTASPWVACSAIYS